MKNFAPVGRRRFLYGESDPFVLTQHEKAATFFRHTESVFRPALVRI